MQWFKINTKLKVSIVHHVKFGRIKIIYVHKNFDEPFDTNDNGKKKYLTSIFDSKKEKGK